jgi:hypothetical protein
VSKHLQLEEHTEQGMKNKRMHVKRFVVSEATRSRLSPLLPLQSQLHLSHAGPKAATPTGPSDRDIGGGGRSEGGGKGGAGVAKGVVPMQSKLMREKRAQLVLSHAAKAGFVLQNEIRYIWFCAMEKVRAVFRGGSMVEEQPCLEEVT